MDTGQPTPASTWLQTTNPAARATCAPGRRVAPRARACRPCSTAAAEQRVVGGVEVHLVDPVPEAVVRAQLGPVPVRRRPGLDPLGRPGEPPERVRSSRAQPAPSRATASTQRARRRRTRRSPAAAAAGCRTSCVAGMADRRWPTYADGMSVTSTEAGTVVAALAAGAASGRRWSPTPTCSSPTGTTGPSSARPACRRPWCSPARPRTCSTRCGWRRSCACRSCRRARAAASPAPPTPSTAASS